MVLAFEGGTNQSGEVASLFACLVDWSAERSQSRKVHEQVVGQIAEVIIVVATNDGTECHTVNTA